MSTLACDRNLRHSSCRQRRLLKRTGWHRRGLFYQRHGFDGRISFFMPFLRCISNTRPCRILRILFPGRFLITLRSVAGLR